jgi:sec-independent protein translocase protein TatA
MLGDLFTGPHIIIVLVIVVLLFGATRLPALAKALGQSGRIFKSEMKSKDKDKDGLEVDDTAADSTDVPAATKTTPKVQS